MERLERIIELAREDKDMNVTTKIAINRGVVKMINLCPKDGNISPSVDVEAFLQTHNTLYDGLSAEECLDEIKRFLEKETENTPSLDVDISRLGEFEAVKENIFFKLVAKEGNEDFALKKEFLDMYKVYYIMVFSKGESTGSITIQPDLLNKWKITVDELDKVATENVAAESVATSMFDTMLDMCGEGFVEMAGIEDVPMFVITNKEKMFGAATLTNKTLLERFEKMWGKFYILPSSIHEVLFVKPRSEDEDEEVMELRQMVHDVNLSTVSPNEVLSFSVYKYDGELSVA